jgi:hypothetical protein
MDKPIAYFEVSNMKRIKFLLRRKFEFEGGIWSVYLLLWGMLLSYNLLPFLPESQQKNFCTWKCLFAGKIKIVQDHIKVSKYTQAEWFNDVQKNYAEPQTSFTIKWTFLRRIDLQFFLFSVANIAHLRIWNWSR